MPNRQIDYTVIVVQGSSLEEAVIVPGRDSYYMKYIDGLVDSPEILRKFTNTAIVFNKRNAKIFASESQCVRFRTALSTQTRPGTYL